MNHNHKGFVFIELVIAFVVLSVLVFVGFKVYNNSSNTASISDSGAATNQELTVTWRFRDDAWQASGSPPACPSPLLGTPVDLSLVESVLYPGQYRGGDYEPHGGFRFPSNQNIVNVTAPLEAAVVSGARYIAGSLGAGKDIQYMFEFHNSCGIAYRIDHLFTLSDKMQALADTLPEAVLGDSRTTDFDGRTTVTKGEILATAVGIPSNQNLYIGWGVYDLRAPNDASKDSAFKVEHEEDGYLSFYAVCWLNLLTPADSVLVKALPATGSEGTKSDYC